MKHRHHLSSLGIATLLASCASPEAPQTPDINDIPDAPIQELVYTPQSSTFHLWAPTADTVWLRLYAEGLGGEALQTITMDRQQQGLWSTIVNQDLLGQFYTFSISQGGQRYGETPGIFARAVGVNGKRGAIIDWDTTDPEGWQDDTKPELKSTADAVIYEMHWRDFSAHASSCAQNRGKFLCLTEEDCISHLKDLGVTHIHILPSYDYFTVDETRLDEPQYNWGYDPVNYNVPDGSYSTCPYDPVVRIREFKQMVQACHQAGIRVVLDVVYNHTMDIEGSNFQRTAPDYFYRRRPDGTYANASGCGNETASEQPMMRKFMTESVCYWMREYHIDGFRFDLMGSHDIVTMNQIAAATRQIDPQVLLYGEGWAAEAPQLPDSLLAMKAHTHELDGIAAFSDDMRDALRGPFWNDEQPAFLASIPGHEENIKFGIVGSIQHPDLDYTKTNSQPWTLQPQQCISYVSCHDDMCLVDRLRTSIPAAKRNEKTLIRLDLLAQTAVLTSQGIPFIFNGEEMLRDKKGVHNSYCSPDSINAIDWNLKAQHPEVFDYYAGLIAMRREHKAFHMGDAELVRQHLHFLSPADSCVVAFQIDGQAVGDSWNQIIVALNGNRKASTLDIPEGDYTVVCRDGKVDALHGLGTLSGHKLTIPAQSAVILKK